MLNNSDSSSNNFNNEPVENEDNSIIEEPKQHFISDENFKKLRQLQQEIFYKTEVSPSIRKIINAFITEENINDYKKKFIQQFTM